MMNTVYNNSSSPKTNKYILPSDPQFEKPNMEEVFNSEVSLRRAIKINERQKSMQEGIKIEEAEKILDWIVYNARVGLNKSVLSPHNEDVFTSDLGGCCGFGQSITGFPLESMGLNVKLNNTSDCISMKAHGHAFLVVGFPIKNNDVEENYFLVDTTYKQFFLSKKCNQNRFFSDDKSFKGHCSPDAGYFINFSEKGKKVACELMQKGYIRLTPENAKIYGDAFQHTAQGLDFYKGNLNEENFKTNISGSEYIEKFMSNTVEHDYRKEEFIKWGCNIDTPYEQAKRIFCKSVSSKLKSAPTILKSAASKLSDNRVINNLKGFKNFVKGLLSNKKSKPSKVPSSKDAFR